MKGFVQGADRQRQTNCYRNALRWVDESNPVRAVDVLVDALVDLRELGFDGVTPAATGRPGYMRRDAKALYLWAYLNRGQSSRRMEHEAGQTIWK